MGLLYKEWRCYWEQQPVGVSEVVTGGTKVETVGC